MDEPPRLKTCDTCFRAKIRCLRTQDSGACDRCLRLGKECYFAPSRRRHQQQRSRAGALGGKAGQGTRAHSKSPGAVGSVDVQDESAGDALPLLSGGMGPMESGTVSAAEAQTILDVYRNRMAQHFPFVMIPADATVETLRSERPCLFLAVLAVGSYASAQLQRTLCRMFNNMVATRLIRGQLISLDVLQGLVVYLAWAHYQPPPKAYSQHLHMATSIVSDLRLDRPQNPNLWNVQKFAQDQDGERQWSLEALRALIGTYYLASSSSIILQKMRHFPYSPFILESSLYVSAAGEYPSDVYLPHIVRVQKLYEDLGDTLGQSPHQSTLAEVNTRLAQLQTDLGVFKSSLAFPLSGCSTLALQLFSQELIVSQVLLPGFPFGSDRFQRRIPDSQQLLRCLAASMSASKSLIGFLLNMTPGEEFVITNFAWIMLSCSLSLATRLDVLARGPRLAPLTQHLLLFLDVQHALRQVTLRLEAAAAAASSPPPSGDEAHLRDQGTFKQFLRRVKAIEEWYTGQIRELAATGATAVDRLYHHEGSQEGSHAESSPSVPGTISDRAAVAVAQGLPVVADHNASSRPQPPDMLTLVGPGSAGGVVLEDFTNFADVSVLDFPVADSTLLDAGGDSNLQFNPLLFFSYPSSYSQ